MEIHLSHKNQLPEACGRKPHMIWADPPNTRCLGVVSPTRHRTWEASYDDLRGGRRTFEARTLHEVREHLRAFYRR
jgi:hypothetical protein